MKKYIRLLIALVLWLVSTSCIMGKVIEEKPIARFQFEKATYQTGEPIKVEDTSYSPSDKKLSQKEWKVIINGKEKKSSQLTTLLSSLEVGTVEVFLHVKDASGVWSEWTSRKLSIVPTKKIEITTFGVEQATLAQGEKIEFIYDYTNPNNLEIKSQRWRYKNLTTGGVIISGKPKYLKNAGIYEVSLELQDEWDNWSNKAVCKLTITNTKIERNGYYLFTKGKPGNLVSGYMDKDYNTFEEIENVMIQDTPGTLMISNSPESIASSGILYKDQVEGLGSVLVHHRNATTYEKKLLVLATTASKEPVTLKVSQMAIKGPSIHILQLGQSALRTYLKGNGEKTYTLRQGETVVLYDSSKEGIWKKDGVISGHFDVEALGSVSLSVVVMDHHSALSNIDKLQVLAKDDHTRGTFKSIGRTYTLDLTNSKVPTKLVLGKEDEWLVGKDALTGEVVKNKGNYGLPMTLKVISKSPVGVILSARGGGYLGAIRNGRGEVFDMPREDVLNGQKMATLVGTISPLGNKSFTYMLPNGSSAPVLFGFIPEILWE